MSLSLKLFVQSGYLDGSGHDEIKRAEVIVPRSRT